MPLPAIFGLPALAGVIGGAVTSAVTFLVTKTGIKVAAVLAALGAMALATSVVLSAVSTAMDAALSGMNQDAMSGLYFLPTNLNHCLSLIAGFHVSLIVYDMAMRVIDIKLQVAK